jgi:flagellar basal body rod protein FlgG
MTQKSINLGTADQGNGDPLRVAFGKVNDNFTELYTALGLIDNSLNLGAFEFTGSVMTTTDSTAIVIDQAATITSNLSVGGDIVPQTANGGDLGSSTLPWRSLYVSNNTIFIGGVPLSLDPGTDELNINNIPISQRITYADIPGAPTDVSDLTDVDGLLGGGGGLSITDFGEGFTDSLDAGKITTSKLYNRPENLALNNQYTLEVTNGGVVALPDGSIINGATLKTIAGNYAGITAGPASPAGKDEDSWVWVDNDGATIATKYSTDAHTWTFNNDGVFTLPNGGQIANYPGGVGASNNSWFVTPGSDGTGGVSSQDGQQYIQINNNLPVEIGTSYGTENESIWRFGRDGDLTLPAGGDILDSNGDSVLGGGSTSYTPDDTDNWNDPAVNTIQAALDELAARVTALQNLEIDGGNAYTPAVGELLIDGNGA